MSFIKDFVSDLATLKLPVTAAAVVATGIAIVSPFGLDPDPVVFTAALVAVGTVAELVKRYLR